MKKIQNIALIIFFLFQTGKMFGQTQLIRKSKVDFDSYEKLVSKVKKYRKNRLITLDTFLTYCLDTNTIILDTRSNFKYNNRHIKGAINLNFSDFTEENLKKILKNYNKRILIYCNNNIEGDEVNFATKSKKTAPNKKAGEKELMLALNVPTFINLYGYGYTNIYELSELVNINDKRISFNGQTEDLNNMFMKLNKK